MRVRLEQLLEAAKANLVKYEGDPRAMRAGAGMVRDLELELEEARIQELEAEGMSRSDAQGVFEAEQMAKARRA